ncbi:HAD hydrolase, subfamily IA [Carpediemonas membranifera]|uniref:HAD hydrolase, subfamily IA n=1 Tax=Carpediemonas membranifera TaxID=201153 RepID=A0A8J6E9A2_9EUKA|nr:HAD hydrolase, subfamily IA [Carpediemonas membranifera]|eukprot:KAG9393040.1 HAD hydrolase, subfamily IA [Carpediemonas membranifera]
MEKNDGTRNNRTLKEILSSAKGIIFDIDGTLAETLGFWRDVDTAYLKRVGRTHADLPENNEEKCAGMSMPEIVQYYIKTLNITDLTPEQGLALFDELVVDFYATRVEFKPNASECLAYLHSRGVPLGYSTAMGKNYLLAMFDHYPEMRKAVGDAYTTTCMVNKGKPAPDVYLATAEKMGVNPGDVVVFEDTIQGIQGARAAGMAAVGVKDVTTDNYGRGDEIRAQADGWIESWQEVLDTLE